MDNEFPSLRKAVTELGYDAGVFNRGSDGEIATSKRVLDDLFGRVPRHKLVTAERELTTLSPEDFVTALVGEERAQAEIAAEHLSPSTIQVLHDIFDALL